MALFHGKGENLTVKRQTKRQTDDKPLSLMYQRFQHLLIIQGGKLSGKNSTFSRQGANSQLTPDKEYKNIKNIRIKKIYILL